MTCWRWWAWSSGMPALPVKAKTLARSAAAPYVCACMCVCGWVFARICVCACLSVCMRVCVWVWVWVVHCSLREFNEELISNGLRCGHCRTTLQCWLLWALAPRKSTPACVGLHTTGADIVKVRAKQDELIFMCLTYNHMGDLFSEADTCTERPVLSVQCLMHTVRRDHQSC